MTSKLAADTTTDSPIDALKTSVGDLAEQAKESGSNALDRVKDLIENHPFEAIGAAFAVGYVLKMLTGPLDDRGPARCRRVPRGIRANDEPQKSSQKTTKRSK